MSCVGTPVEAINLTKTASWHGSCNRLAIVLAHTDAKPGGTCQSCSPRIQSLQVPQETQRLTQNPFEVPNVLKAHTDTSRLTVPLLAWVSDRSPKWLFC